ncbi:hypothetical protein [Aureliella helgolandensis]|nr:hypothetical protein [Aureliella helgolandensis]
MRFQLFRLFVMSCSLASLVACAPESGPPASAEPEDAATEQSAAMPNGPPVIQAQQALAGVGKRGQSLKNESGIAKIITGPASALFNVEQKAVLEFQIPPAINMFKATEGRFPNSHEEFMQKIVKANSLQLPELPEGAVYKFNSEKGELWVYPEDQVPE